MPRAEKFDIVHHYAVQAVHGVQEADHVWVAENRGGDILAVGQSGGAEPAWVQRHRAGGGTVQVHRCSPSMVAERLATGQRSVATRRAAG